MRILKERSAGLVIDIQERLFPHIHEHEVLLKNVGVLLEGLNLLEIPVVVTEQYRKGLGDTLAPVRERISGFEPIEKMSFSCCDDKSFADQFQGLGKQFVIVCGIEAHVCVLQTVIDLLEKGYTPVIVENCISSRKLTDKQVAIERMKQEGAVISTYESILFELARISGTEVFKKISKLVK